MPHLDMGKYALFVWPAWGLSLAVIGGLTIQTFGNAARAARELARREQEAGARPGEVASGSPKGRAPSKKSGAFPSGKGSGR